jgi:hypothetical protein
MLKRGINGIMAVGETAYLPCGIGAFSGSSSSSGRNNSTIVFNGFFPGLWAITRTRSSSSLLYSMRFSGALEVLIEGTGLTPLIVLSTAFVFHKADY